MMADPTLLSVDPGRDKCGVAVLRGRSVLEHRILPASELPAAARSLHARHRIDMMIVGDQTGSSEVRRLLAAELPGVPLVVVEERGTTLEARRLYFEEHPRRGWRRLLPVSMQVPGEPYDDFAAIALARRHLGEAPSKAP